MVAVSSWGRLSSFEHSVVGLYDRDQISEIINKRQPGLAYGMGRSYGDVCLNPNGTLWVTRRLNHYISFDNNNGRLVCEAGVLLKDIQLLMAPRGWMLPVTPGTQYVTVAGAIANDVHGKNHHSMGTFGNHILNLTVMRTNGEIIHCGPNQCSDWFSATVGGMGLTGLITQAEIQLRRVSGPWLNVETLPYESLGEFFQLSEASEANYEYTVSWIDCVSASGRGLFMRANHSDANDVIEPQGRQFSMPIVPPVSLVNEFSLRPLNAAYYSLKKWKAGQEISHYKPFFYPLDNLLNWNRMYGPRGFFQYQCVVPYEDSCDSIKALLKEIRLSGVGSFLAVLKTFGSRQSPGMLSFPLPGVTLALDFPNHGDRTHKLFGRLDAVVREAGGRIYPAKDARMPKTLFEAGYRRLNEFNNYRDPGISSALSRRLMGS